MAEETYVPMTSAEQDKANALDAERTAWEASRDHDPGTGSPHAKGETSETGGGTTEPTPPPEQPPPEQPPPEQPPPEQPPTPPAS
jgi:hypothetical protein